MASAWSDIGDEHEDDPSFVVGSVDCTDESSKPLCDKHGVTGLPSLKYFMPPDPVGELYEGDRTLEMMGAFAKQLANGCYASTLDRCAAAERKDFEDVASRGVEKVRSTVTEMRGQLAEARAVLEEKGAALREMKEAWGKKKEKAKAKEEAIAAQNTLKGLSSKLSPGLRVMKAVLAAHGGTNPEGAKAKAAKSEL